MAGEARDPTLRVGTSGWSYNDWVGPFYPVSLRHDPSEWLTYYATRFRTVEINSTFYAFPGEDLVATWARKAVEILERAPFEFSLKLPQDVTHRALPDGALDEARAITGRFDREVLDPLDGEGLLGAVLLQLPPWFHCTAANVSALHRVLEPLAERQVALEFRHPSWIEHARPAEAATRIMGNPDVAWALLDGPAMPDLDPAPPARHAYVRLHGRNRDAWNRAPNAPPQDRHARYDYLYTSDELAPWADRIRRLASERSVTRVYFNNHPLGKAAANALDLLHLLGEATDVPRPKLTEQTRLL